MDGMHQPLIKKDNNSNPVIIQSRKKDVISIFNTSDSILMVENMCEIHV